MHIAATTAIKSAISKVPMLRLTRTNLFLVGVVHGDFAKVANETPGSVHVENMNPGLGSRRDLLLVEHIGLCFTFGWFHATFSHACQCSLQQARPRSTP